MPVIKTNKQYDYLVTFGCSFTGGHQLGPDGAWGYYLARRLGCNHRTVSGGASNPNIATSVINFVENNDTTNVCIGIQWSEATRREIWKETINNYHTIGLGGLLEDTMWRREPEQEFLQPIRNNLGYFSSVYFDIRENVLRTVQSMIHVKAYLEYKNIDFIQFEGINSILDRIENQENIKYDGSGHPTYLALINDDVKKSIVSDDTFFSELGDLNKAMRLHPAFDPSLNDGHPHPVILDYWTDHLYNYLKTLENKN